MPRAIERDRKRDPMLDVWTEAEYKKNVTDNQFVKQLPYGVNEAAYHWMKTRGKKTDDMEKYKKIISEFFLELSRNIIQKNYPYTWYRVGEFYISKFNGSPALNSLKSMKHKRILSFVNLATSGWIYQFYWARKRTIFYNRDCYTFTAVEGKHEICGKRGVKGWIRKLHDDNKLTDYNAFVRNDAMAWRRRKKREEQRAKEKQDRENKIKELIS